MIAMTSEQIAALVQGELRGPANVVITGVRALDGAGEADLSFVAQEDLVPTARESKAGALITHWPIDGYAGAQIVCSDPELAVCRLLETVQNQEPHRPSGISESACISASATLGERVAVGACSVIEDDVVLGDDVAVGAMVCIGRGVRIGARSVIRSHVTIGHYVQIGSDCVFHPNCVVGDDGFGYIQRDGRSIKMPHVGSVRIGNNVEIRGLSSVDRGMVEDTVIGDGVKIDKHCQVAHNCHVGDHCVLAGGTLLGGSVTLGRGVLLGGRVGITDHVTVGDGARLAAGSAVIGNVKAGETVSGHPARPIGQSRRIWALEGRLPEMSRRLKALEEEMRSLRERLPEEP